MWLPWRRVCVPSPGCVVGGLPLAPPPCRLSRPFRPCAVRSVSSSAIAVALSHEVYLPSGAAAAAAPVPSPPPLLILHGLFGSKQNWRSLAKALANRLGARVVAVDLRNHGDSPHTPVHNYEAMTLDVELLCERLGIETLALLGHKALGVDDLPVDLIAQLLRQGAMDHLERPPPVVIDQILDVLQQEGPRPVMLDDLGD
ncbi:Alpha/beta hydrolase domain-containing protein 11, partial [Cladochytrium tenue]